MMSNPFALLSVSASASGSSLAPNSLSPLGGVADSEEFMKLMSALQNSGTLALVDQQATISLENGTSAQLYMLSSTDPDLQNFLSNYEAERGSVLPDSILQALTNGIPALLLPENGATDFAPLSAEQLSELVSSHGDALSGANVLLIATNAAPSDLETLAQSIAQALSHFQQPEGTVSEAVEDAEGPNGQPKLTFVLVSFSASTEENDATNDALSSKDDDLTDPSVNWYLFSGFVTPPDTKTASTSADVLDVTEDIAALSASSTYGDVDGSSKGKRASPFDATNGNTAPQADDGVDTGNNAIIHAAAGRPSDTAQPNASALAHSAAFSHRTDSSASARFMNGVSSEDWTTGQLALTGDNATASYLMSADNSVTGRGVLTNPVLNNPAAATGHPAAQALAAILEKHSQNGEVKSQTLSVELDPPELGRVQVHLSYEKGEPMKVKVVTDNEDTLNMLKRDAHSLRQALESAGVQTDGSSLSFDMSQDQSAFGQAMAQQNSNDQSASRKSFHINGSDFGISGSDTAHGSDVIDTALGITTDAQTGEVHYNLLA